MRFRSDLFGSESIGNGICETSGLADVLQQLGLLVGWVVGTRSVVSRQGFDLDEVTFIEYTKDVIILDVLPSALSQVCDQL